MLPARSPSPQSMDGNSDRLSPLTLLTAATNQAGSGGAVDGEKSDRRGSGGKRSGAHSKLSVSSSPSPPPSRSPSLTKPMAAMSVASKGSGSTGGSDSSSSGSDRIDSSEDGSRPSSSDDASPFPPDRADDGDSNSQQEERSTTPDSAEGRQTSDVSCTTTDGASSDCVSTDQLAQHSAQQAVKAEAPVAMQTC